MSAIVVWMDGEHAKLFKLSPAGVAQEQIKNHHHMHHTSADASKHGHDHDKYFEELSKHLQNTTEVLLCGPGVAKTQFDHFLKTKHSNIAKSIVGVETMDHPTDNQILATARKFFKKFDAFQ